MEKEKCIEDGDHVVKNQENDILRPSAAIELSEQYEEILVDEYRTATRYRRC